MADLMFTAPTTRSTSACAYKAKSANEVVRLCRQQQPLEPIAFMLQAQKHCIQFSNVLSCIVDVN